MAPEHPTVVGTADPPVKEPSAGTDARLVLRARGGVGEAFGGLYDRWAATVHGLLVADGPRGEEADLVHEVFLRAMRSLSSLNEPERFGPWLCTIARNLARDALRRAGRRGAVGPLLGDLEHDARRSQPTEHAVEAAKVLDRLRELPEAYRETLALRLVEGLSGPEIAERTGRSEGAIRVNLHRGMKLLRERLQL